MASALTVTRRLSLRPPVSFNGPGSGAAQPPTP